MANSVQRLLHIAQSIEEVLQKRHRRSRLRRLFSLNSDERLLTTLREELRNTLEILRVEFQIETRITVDYMNDRLNLLQEVLDLRNPQHTHGPPQQPNSNSYDGHGQFQAVREVPAAASSAGPYSVAQSTNTYIQDHSLIIDGSDNNVTMIMYGPPRNY